MLFQQQTAPTGWTRDNSSVNERALRVVRGDTNWSGSGGSVDFTTAFSSQSVSGTTGDKTAGGSIGGSTASTTLSSNQIPSHFHRTFRSGNHGEQRNNSNLSSNNYPGSGTGASDIYESYNIVASNSVANRGKTSNTGGGGGHTHGSGTLSFSGTAHNHSFSDSVNLAVKYLDVIIAEKN